MQNEGLVSDLVKLFEKLICLNLFINKDEYASFVVVLTEELHQSPEFVFLRGNNLDKLLDILTSLSTIANDNLDRRG